MRPSTRFLTAGIIAVLAAVLIVTGGWFVVTGAVEAGIARWAEARGNEGLIASWDRLERGGFPFTARVRVFGPRIVATDGALPLREWRGPSLDVAFSLFAPGRVIITTGGRHVLAFAGSDDMAEMVADVDGLAITLPTGNRSPATAEAALAGVTLRDGSGRQVLRGAKAKAMLDRPRDDEATLTFSVQSLEIPVLPETRLGRRLGPIDARIMLAGQPPETMRAVALAGWRDAGGRVVIERLHAEWGALAGDVTGRLALDQRLQPAGTLDARLTGLRDAIRAAKDLRVIDDGTATLLQLTLGAFTSGSVALPIVIEDRRVTAGPVRLFRLPRIRWP